MDRGRGTRKGEQDMRGQEKEGNGMRGRMEGIRMVQKAK